MKLNLLIMALTPVYDLRTGLIWATHNEMKNYPAKSMQNIKLDNLILPLSYQFSFFSG